MDICSSNKVVTKKIYDFLINVPEAGEETISDYLVWKLREIDNRFRFVNAQSFTRHEENTKTGADFQLELVIIGKRKQIRLLFQAKKLPKEYYAYRNKLRYKNDTKSQINKLMDYSNIPPVKKPVYAFYSSSAGNTTGCCNRVDSDKCGLHVCLASTVDLYTKTKKGSKISRSDILGQSIPFHCLFCCTISKSENVIIEQLIESAEEIDENMKLRLADFDNISERYKVAELFRPSLVKTRIVGWYDLSSDDESLIGRALNSQDLDTTSEFD